MIANFCLLRRQEIYQIGRGIGQISYNYSLKPNWAYYNIIISHIVAIHQWNVVHNGLLLSFGNLSRLAKIWKVSGMTKLAKRPYITLYDCIPAMYSHEPHQFFQVCWTTSPGLVDPLQKETPLKPNNRQPSSESIYRDTMYKSSMSLEES